MIRLSASSVRDFVRCSKMYDFRMNYPEASVDTQEAAVGRLIHKVVEEKWQDRESGMALAKNLITEYNIDMDGFEKIYTSLDNFYDNPEIQNKLSDQDQIEYYFKVAWEEGVQFSGKMDRILVDNTVIDWKTGRTKKYLSNDVQFILYHTMYKKIFGVYPRVLQINLYKNVITEYQPNKRFTDELLREVIPAMIERIKEGRIYREGFFNGSCYGCNFIGICYADT